MATNPPKIGKYDVVDLIGRGGMGVVYKAIDPAIGRLVAIKMMTAGFGSDPDLLKRFYREAQSVGKLQHPNIVTVYELGDLDGTPFLAMEFIEGESLDRVIHDRRELPLDDKLGFLVQVCNGLQYAHERSIVHRDIKPGNIMVTTSGTVKIVDFGLAHVGADGMTRPGQVMGSINYMSPEQINGQPVDLRTDIFATGVVLYQLLSYALPFQGADTGSTLLKIIHEPPAPLDKYLKNYPQDLDDVIQRALAKDREARYPSAGDFADGLLEILERLKREKIDRYLGVVQELLAASELEKAQEQLSQVLKLDRQHRRGNELMREVRQRIQKRKAQQRAQELRGKAEAALERQNFEDALVDLQEAVRLDESNASLIQLRDSVQEAKTRRERIGQALQRAESSQASGELEESLKGVEEVLALEPNHAEARAMHAAVSNALRERERRKKLQELTDRARKQIAVREFQQALETLQQAEQIDAAVPAVHELRRTVAAGLEQERRRREIERVAGEIEEALNRDDYRAALAKAKEGERQFGDERRLQQLKMLAEKQREAAERRIYIGEQIAAARKLLESGRTTEALAMVEAACGKYPGETALQSMHAMVKETLAREEREQEQAECTQKAKELLRRKQYSDAIAVLESGRERLKTSELDDLIQFVREEAALDARRQKVAAATEQANRLISAEDYEAAIALLQTALVEFPDGGLQALLADAQHQMAEFRQGVAEAVAAAQRLMSQLRMHEAVRLLESKPRSFARATDFADTLQQVRDAAKRMQAVSVAKEQVRDALANEDFEKAAAIALACRQEIGEMTDLALLDVEIAVQRTQVFRRRVESAVADARTLLIGRSYRSALDILTSVAPYMEAVSAELQAQYDSLRSHALAGTTRQQSEAELRQPAIPPGKDYGPSSGLTLPQTHWTLAGAATPVMPPDVAPPLPAVVPTREVNIIGQGDSSSVHDRDLGQLPLGPMEIGETAILPPEQAEPRAAEVPETIHLEETQVDDIDRTDFAVPLPAAMADVADTELVSSSSPVAEIHDTKKTKTVPTEKIAPTETPGAPKRGLSGRPLIIGLVAIAVLLAGVLVRWGRQSAPAVTVLIPISTSPEGATVRINQKDVCVTPNCRISVAAGSQELQVRKAGYEPVTQVLAIKSTAQAPEPLLLQLKPLKQALQISTNFRSGKVSLNKTQIASLQDGQFLMQDLPIGSHILDVQGPDAEASVAFEARSGQAPTITKVPEGKEAQVIVVSSLASDMHVACNCTEPVAVDGKAVGKIGPGGLDLRGITPGTHQLNIGEGGNQHTVTISAGQAPLLDLFLASNRNVGMLVVETRQTGVDIFVNGKKYGRPSAQPMVRIPLDVKSYEVQVQKHGYRASPPQQAEVRRNQDTKLVFNLEPEPATLLVRGAPAEVGVSIDGNRIGATGPRGFFTAKVGAGEHVIELTKSGFSPRSFRKQFNPGETVTLARGEIQMAELQPPRPAEVKPPETRTPAVASAESKPPASVSAPAPVPTGPAQEWERISTSRDTAVLENFRKKYPDSSFSKQAAQKIEQLDWEGAKSAGDATALQAFLKKYPNGSFSEAAKTALANLDTQRLVAERQSVRDVLRRFAAAYDRKDADEVATLYPSLNKRELKKIRDSFKAAQSVSMTLRPMGDLRIGGDQATVTCSRSIRYTFKDGEPNPVADTVTVELSKKGGLWIIESMH